MSNIFDETQTTVAEHVEYEQPYQPPMVRPMPTSSAASDLLALLPAAAQLPPRDPARMVALARRTGERLAAQLDGQGNNRALYGWTQAGKRIEGPTVGLVEALATEWGCLATRVDVTSVDGDRVTVQGVVIDLQTLNVYARPSIFTLPPAPGKYAEKADQMQRWESMQTQSALSKAIRVALQHALPAWYVGAAVEAARGALTANVLKGKTPSEAASDAVTAFDRLGVTVPQLEVFVGAARALWTVSDIVSLRTTFQRIKSGEATIAGTFAQAPTGLAGLGKPTIAAHIAAMIRDGEAAVGPDGVTRARASAGVVEVTPENAGKYLQELTAEAEMQAAEEGGA